MAVLRMFNAALVWRLADQPHPHRNITSLEIPPFRPHSEPHVGQVWDVFLGSILISGIPIHRALYSSCWWIRRRGHWAMRRFSFLEYVWGRRPWRSSMTIADC